MFSLTYSKHTHAKDAVDLGLCTPAATSKRPASAATPATPAHPEEEQQDGKSSTCIASVIENRAKEVHMLGTHCRAVVLRRSRRLSSYATAHWSRCAARQVGLAVMDLLGLRLSLVQLVETSRSYTNTL